MHQKIEAALITNDRATASKVRSLIIQLAHQSHEIDDKFLGRIGRIKVSRKRPESSRTPTPKERDKPVVRVLTKHGVRLDNPHALSFRRKTFALTGFFDSGTQDECAQATRDLGGRRSPGNAVTRRVDVLVVGTRGNPDFFWKTYVRKMERGNKLRQRWRKPLIVSGSRWRNEIRSLTRG